MQREWRNDELIIVNRLLNNGKIDDHIYYILSESLKKFRERYHTLEYRSLHGMHINELLYDLDIYYINHNTMSVYTILRCFLIDILASKIVDFPNSNSPFDILVSLYLNLQSAPIINLDYYQLDVWGFYILLENAGIDIVDQFLNELRNLQQIHINNKCNKINYTHINQNRF